MNKTYILFCLFLTLLNADEKNNLIKYNYILYFL